MRPLQNPFVDATRVSSFVTLNGTAPSHHQLEHVLETSHRPSSRCFFLWSKIREIRASTSWPCDGLDRLRCSILPECSRYETKGAVRHLGVCESGRIQSMGWCWTASKIKTTIEHAGASSRCLSTILPFLQSWLSNSSSTIQCWLPWESTGPTFLDQCCRI
jgi:hypothetical protein